MKLATRYGLAGLAGLAMLTGVQWLRQQHPQLGPVETYLVGVAPNFAAAIAITFVLLSIWTDQRSSADKTAIRFRFAVCAAISAAGLIGWECIQMSSRNLVFDLQDMLATLVGIAVSALIYAVVTPNAADPT